MSPKWHVKAFEEYVFKDLQCKVELPRAYRAFNKAKLCIEGSLTNQYKMLYGYIEEIHGSNRRTTVVLKTKKNVGPNKEYMFRGLYIG